MPTRSQEHLQRRQGYTSSQRIGIIDLRPIVQQLPLQTNDEQDVVSVQVDATDPGEETLSYADSGLPSPLAVNSSTGEITGTIDVGESNSSPFSCSITVTNTPSGLQRVMQFQWVVNP